MMRKKSDVIVVGITLLVGHHQDHVCTDLTRTVKHPVERRDL